jgi:hypothetical protein
VTILTLLQRFDNSASLLAIFAKEIIFNFSFLIFHFTSVLWALYTRVIGKVNVSRFSPLRAIACWQQSNWGAQATEGKS